MHMFRVDARAALHNITISFSSLIVAPLSIELPLTSKSASMQVLALTQGVG